MSRVWADQTITDHRELIVLLAIADFANDAGIAWPSIDSIASKSRFSRRSVFYVLESLKKTGKLTIKTGGGRASSTYKIKTYEPCKDCTPPVQELQGTRANRLHGTRAKQHVDFAHDPLGTVTDPLKICTKSRPQRPSMDDLKKACKEKGLPETDGEWLFHKWEGNGWTNDGKPVKSHLGTIAQWKIQKIFPSQKAQFQFREPPRNQI